MSILETLKTWDGETFRALNGRLHGPLTDAVTRFIDREVLFFGIILGATAVYATLRGPRSRRTWTLVLAAGLAAWVASSFVLKPTVRRVRPWWAETVVIRTAAKAPARDDWSFPSSHAAVSSALAVAYAALGPRRVLGAVAILGAILCGLSRIHAGVHYPLDVATGLALGSLVALGATTCYRRCGILPASPPPGPPPGTQGDAS